MGFSPRDFFEVGTDLRIWLATKAQAVAYGMLSSLALVICFCLLRLFVPFFLYKSLRKLRVGRCPYDTYEPYQTSK